MIIKEVEGNLFNAERKYTFVHCISEDCAMSAGIALQFQNIFRMRDYLLNNIERFNRTYPTAILFRSNGRRNIINMITKEKYWNKPTYDDFNKSLDEVVEICIRNNIKHLAMPRIGCGLDGLNWNKVRTMIEYKFRNMDIEIIVYYI